MMKGLTKNLLQLLKRLKHTFDEEGWYCVISDKYNFNQNPDLKIDFNVDFQYKDVRTISIIDIENRILLNAYFYIVDHDTVYLLGDNSGAKEPVMYKKCPENYDEFITVVKKVMNYY